MSTCKSCKAEILWAVTASGNAMPLDAKAETMFVVETGAEVTCKAVQARRSHFATCPDSAKHRKPRTP